MAPPNKRENAQPTLYEILSLTPKHLEGQTATAQSKVVKKAYHRALLQNHPDKVDANNNNSNGNNSGSGNSDDGGDTPANPKTNGKKSQPSSSSSTTIYTVDQIQEAYNTLSDTKKRAAYNRSLAVSSSSATSTSTSSRGQQQHFSFTRSFQTGLEIVDLDDCDFDEKKGLYFRACRCGNPRGYRFKERDLEDNEDEGVLMVECLDCSLWLRVLFTAAVASDGDNNGAQNTNNNSSINNNTQRQNSTASSSSSQQQQPMQQRNNSQSVSRNNSGGETKKAGWTFKVSLGLSLGGSASIGRSQ